MKAFFLDSHEVLIALWQLNYDFFSFIYIFEGDFVLRFSNYLKEGLNSIKRTEDDFWFKIVLSLVSPFTRLGEFYNP